jgi:hypothetical protein
MHSLDAILPADAAEAECPERHVGSEDPVGVDPYSPCSQRVCDPMLAVNILGSYRACESVSSVVR